MPAERPVLLFVYNADGGPLNGLKDLWHKTVSPQTYACSLCAVTYGPLGMRREWRDFVRGLGREVRFLHRDELAAEFGLRNVPLPAVYELRPEGTLQEWLPASELRAVTTLKDLMRRVAERAQAPQPIFSPTSNVAR
ncbi:hypothetical protein RDMS_03240 [Deinococcus sp. RL]|uniref:hypothetical protein n=1 Tax=Deinococcus sp. RL TaxID=1489678 RepID=UPI0004D44411|nr:hypothetical protein [Deinococcus sp. RL]KEF35058.1 hypothetical protein RDMS_03240 [Deinococcus sp. RL]